MTVTRLEFRKTGGFMGILKGCDLDLLNLPAAERSKVEALVQSSNLLSLSSHTERRARDVYYYHITATTSDGKEHGCKFDDVTLPPALRPLVQLLEARSSNLKG